VILAIIWCSQKKLKKKGANPERETEREREREREIRLINYDLLIKNENT
jgi:hypothetical protein